jgi:hypothetical protein
VEHHDIDPIALVFGVLFSILGLTFAIGRWSWFDISGGWTLALLLIGLGIAGLLVSTLRPRSRGARN